MGTKKDPWWRRLSIPAPHIPKVYTFLKWCFLIIIAVCCALVGFGQSYLVSMFYMIRSTKFIFRVVEDHHDSQWQWSTAFEYIGLNALLAFSCSFMLFVISPAASGSGIPDVKAYLNGVESPIFKNFFTVKTFVAKVIASALGVSSGLAMGKEGPMLHAGSILAVLLGSNKWMLQQMEVAAHWGVYTYNKELRDLVAIGAACGVTTAFKAPVGGVLFAMELATRWRKDLTWRCFLACAIAIVVVRIAITVCDKNCQELKYGSLIFFKQNYPANFEQVWAVMILSVIGGYLGCLFTSFNTWICLVRKKWTKFMWARILEVVCISLFTSIVYYFLPLVGQCRDCRFPGVANCVAGDGVEFHTFAGYHCKAAGEYNDMAVLVFNPQGFKIQALFTAPAGAASEATFSLSTLALYAAIFWFLACVTYGAFIPSGLFTPSLIFGGCLGRCFAKILILMGVPNVDVGMYALLGSAAFLGGLMRMSAAMALILMEMTSSPQQLPFLMLTLVLSKQVGDQFNYGVFEHQMMLKGLAFVGIDENMAKKHKIPAKDVMTHNTRNITLYSTESAKVLEAVLDLHRDMGAFPVTEVPREGQGDQGDFLGMISRKNVNALLEQHGHEAEEIDLREKIEVSPIIIPPNMPLPFIYRIVNAEGFNYVPVIRVHGPLEGVISRQELVDVQNKKLDEHHLKEQIERMAVDIEKGRIIQSMNLTDNIHAAKFKEGAKTLADGAINFLKNPIKATKHFIEEEEDKLDDQQEFFLGETRAGSLRAPGAGGAGAGTGAGSSAGGPSDDTKGAGHGGGNAHWMSIPPPAPSSGSSRALLGPLDSIEEAAVEGGSTRGAAAAGAAAVSEVVPAAAGASSTPVPLHPPPLPVSPEPPLPPHAAAPLMGAFGVSLGAPVQGGSGAGGDNASETTPLTQGINRSS